MSVGHRIHIASGQRTLVDIDRFEVPANRITLLLGESGIGKSLMAKAVYGLLDSDDLTVTIDGRSYEQYCKEQETIRLQQQSFFVFQEPSTHLHPLLTLREQLNEGSLGDAPNEAEILAELWKNASTDIRHLLDVYPKPYRPSGGEKQRILLAMAFKKIDLLQENSSVRERPFFVFDEPTGSLDNVYRDLFIDMLLKRFRTKPFTCLLITHDYSMIGKLNESHADVMEKISFKEVHLRNGHLALDDFAPKLYLDWLKGLKIPGRAGAEQRVALSISSGAEVFGRRLIITRERQGSEECQLDLHKGEIVYLKAASGVGKTTLVKLVMGLLKAQRLEARLDGITLTPRTPASVWHGKLWGKRMTMVFQHADEALNAESTVAGVFTGLPTLRNPDAGELLRLMRELFDEPDRAFLTKKVKHLSGGQKQRLNLLRGFALDTDILILDEPLNGLDFESAGKVIAMLQRKQREGKGILLISHNEEIFDAIVPPRNIYFLRAEIL